MNKKRIDAVETTHPLKTLLASETLLVRPKLSHLRHF
jgi:hypothetical protein